MVEIPEKRDSRHGDMTEFPENRDSVVKGLKLLLKIMFGNAPIKNWKLLSSFTGMVAHESFQLELKCSNFRAAPQRNHTSSLKFRRNFERTLTECHRNLFAFFLHSTVPTTTTYY